MTISRRQIGAVAFLALTATAGTAPALAESTDEAAVAGARFGPHQGNAGG